MAERSRLSPAQLQQVLQRALSSPGVDLSAIPAELDYERVVYPGCLIAEAGVVDPRRVRVALVVASSGDQHDLGERCGEVRRLGACEVRLVHRAAPRDAWLVVASRAHALGVAVAAHYEARLRRISSEAEARRDFAGTTEADLRQMLTLRRE